MHSHVQPRIRRVLVPEIAGYKAPAKSSQRGPALPAEIAMAKTVTRKVFLALSYDPDGFAGAEPKSSILMRIKDSGATDVDMEDVAKALNSLLNRGNAARQRQGFPGAGAAVWVRRRLEIV